MRAATAFTLALPLITGATAVSRTANIPTSQCNTGPIQCCNNVVSADSPLAGNLAGLLGIVLGSVTGLIGIGCSPISAIGIGGNACSQQPVCCVNNSFNGVMALGCTPVNLNL